MQRSVAVYLLDIIECCNAVEEALEGIDLDAYLNSRMIRSSVEREFLIIGEAINCLSRLSPCLGQRITHARLIVGFRNRLAHEYSAIDDEAVLGIANHDISVLKRECQDLLGELPITVEDAD